MHLGAALCYSIVEVEQLIGCGGISLPIPVKLRMPLICFIAVRLWVIRFIAERETTQTYS